LCNLNREQRAPMGPADCRCHCVPKRKAQAWRRLCWGSGPDGGSVGGRDPTVSWSHTASRQGFIWLINGFLATLVMWLYGLQCQSFHHFSPKWNISTTIGWIAMKLCTHMHVPQRRHSNLPDLLWLRIYILMALVILWPVMSEPILFSFADICIKIHWMTFLSSWLNYTMGPWWRLYVLNISVLASSLWACCHGESCI